jgi:hypothetical protein
MGRVLPRPLVPQDLSDITVPNLDPALVARPAIAVMDGLELQFLLDPERDIVTPLTAWLAPLYESSGSDPGSAYDRL